MPDGKYNLNIYKSIYKNDNVEELTLYFTFTTTGLLSEAWYMDNGEHRGDVLTAAYCCYEDSYVVQYDSHVRVSDSK